MFVGDFGAMWHAAPRMTAPLVPIINHLPVIFDCYERQSSHSEQALEWYRRLKGALRHEACRQL
jgi:hypothetical protein